MSHSRAAQWRIGRSCVAVGACIFSPGVIVWVRADSVVRPASAGVGAAGSMQQQQPPANTPPVREAGNLHANSSSEPALYAFFTFAVG